MTVGLRTWIDPSLPTAPRELEELQQKILRRAIGPAVVAASEYLATVEKASVVHDHTGILRESVGSTKAKIYPDALTAWAGSGPTRGHARMIPSKNPKGQPFKVNPVRYAHFVIAGRKASIAGRGRKKAKSLFDPFTGRFFGKQVAAAPKADFMAPAENQADSALEAYRTTLAAKLAAM